MSTDGADTEAATPGAASPSGVPEDAPSDGDAEARATAGGSGTTLAPPPAPAVFRTARSGLVAVVFLAMCLSPIAFQGGPWFLLFVLPLVVGWWVVRTRTVVDADGVTARTAWGSTRWPWSRVATLRLLDRGWVRAVATRPDGADGPADELVLRGVRIRDLGRVGEASGGRISAPSPGEALAAIEHARELEAARMRIAAFRRREGAAAEAEPTDDAAAEKPADADGPGAVDAGVTTEEAARPGRDGA